MTDLDTILTKSDDVDIDWKVLEVVISTGDECRISFVGECNGMSVRERDVTIRFHLGGKPPISSLELYPPPLERPEIAIGSAK